MPVLNVSLQGRFGNATLQWLFCRGIAERYGYDLTCDAWIGERVFDLPKNRYSGPDLPRLNENTLERVMQDGKLDVEFRGYAQQENCVTYTRKKARDWLKFSRFILERHSPWGMGVILAHRRVGDYFGYGYPIIGEEAYRRACDEWALDVRQLRFVTEEKPMGNVMMPDDLLFITDFYYMTTCSVLLRANSSFSFVAGLLNPNIVLSPRIDGLQGGIEHDNVRFEVGNHCRLSDFDFCSDLIVAP